jgi:hypothetical protein
VSLHHVEIWVPDLGATVASWGWLLSELGWQPYQDWPGGRSWRDGDTYLVFEQSPALSGRRHDRLAPGLNHLALHGGPPERVDRLHRAAPEHGWRPLFADGYPHAGGAAHYAAYLENADGFEVEIVAQV